MRKDTPPPKIINYYVQVPAHEFNGYGYGMYGPYGMVPPPRYGYQRHPRPSHFPAAHLMYRQRPSFMRTPRFSYRNAWRTPH
nr:female-specific protein transformer [Drosophila bipectinata]